MEIDIAKEQFIAQGLMILARNYLEVYPYDKWSDKVMPWSNISSTSLPTSDLAAKHLLTISGCFTQSLCPEWVDQEAVPKRFSFPPGYPAVSEGVSLSAHHGGDGGWGNQSSLAPHRSRSHCSHGKTRHWSVWAAWPLALGRGNSPQGILQMLLQIRNHFNGQIKRI